MDKEKKNRRDKYLKDLGKKVREARENKGYSQHELASIAQIPKNQVGRIERGEINTSVFTLQEVAEALEVNITQLLTK
ncbi:helix-turn-helix domain-containing protein [Spongiimicrobium salis]|uniref:helix-turn-helix domain-containing protein n=1 Tax=Spongiimicrobium salis TaxID=1667022 RepID=UPI00374DE18E